MSGHRFSMIHGGGAVLLFVVALMFMMVVMPFGAQEAQASAGARRATTSIGDVLAAGGTGTWLILLLGLSAVVVTAIGAAGVRRDHAWPHWRSLVRGLGEAAFLVGILSAVTGMIMGFDEITRLGASVTPADLSSGFHVALISVLFGTLVSIGTLLCAGILRLLGPARAGSGG